MKPRLMSVKLSDLWLPSGVTELWFYGFDMVRVAGGRVEGISGRKPELICTVERRFRAESYELVLFGQVHAYKTIEIVVR